MQRKQEKPKFKLTITVPQSQKNIKDNGSQQQEIYVKPMYSMKNSRKVPIKFNFDQQRLEMLRLRKSKKLQKEKDILVRSLGALKGGAISAIAEKQEQIDKLKSQLGWQQVKQLQNEVQQLLQERNQLKKEIKQLQQKLQFERQGYIRLLEQKDRVIEELYVQLQSTQFQIEKLQKFEQIKQKKIKIIQQQNNYLFCQLQQEKIAHIKQNYQNTQNNMTFRCRQDQTENINDQQSQQFDRIRVESHHLCLDTVEARHEQQLKQLAVFYQKRINEMRQIYQKELQLWPYSKQNSLKNQLMEDVESLRQTNIAAPNKLSNQITLLSDCYSMTKRAQSKADNRSLYISDKTSVDLNASVFGKITKTPASQTTMSFKKGDEYKFVFKEGKRQNETQISEEKQSEKSLTCKQSKELKYFIGGALAGGVFGFLINNILERIK